MKSDARVFADHLHRLFGPHNSIRVVGSQTPGLPPICCFFFPDRSRAGVTIAVTYGLSLSKHPAWMDEQPELLVRVQSADESWGLAAASFAQRLRGEHAFGEGSILMGPTALSDESEMSGFLLCPQNVVTDEQGGLDVDFRTLRLRGAVPIYECEQQFIEQIGGVAFLSRPADFLDVQRDHVWE